jgi:phosphopantothenoylcysteine decarboxylase / phosphopantothenate---cysteine ligase
LKKVLAQTPDAEERWLEGRRVVVTAGGTREPIDPVRFLGNRSSGKMGNALARAALDAGADVTLITAAEPPPGAPHLDVVRVETAAEMGDAVRRAIAGANLLIMAAAVADYRPTSVSPAKIKKHDAMWMLELEPTVDILASLRDVPERSSVFVVGFAAETSDLTENAQAKLNQKGLDLIVLNDVSRADIAMSADHNEVTIIDRDGIVASIPRATKDVVAAEILRVVRSRLS